MASGLRRPITAVSIDVTITTFISQLCLVPMAPPTPRKCRLFLTKPSKSALIFHFLALALLTLAPAISFAAGSERVGEKERVLHDNINTIRAEYGLFSLHVEKAAADAAEAHAEELLGRHILSHRGIDGSRVNERYRRAAGTALYSGEILGAGDSIAQVIGGWMNSPSHHDSILNPNWTSMGVGIRNLNEERLLIVVVFTSSHWRFRELRMDNNVVVLLGDLLTHPRSCATDFYLEINGKIIAPKMEIDGTESICPNTVESWVPVSFRFRWAESIPSGGIVPVFLHISPHLEPTDLIFLRCP